MQQLYLFAVQGKWYGDKVRSWMFHLVNFLPHALGSVPEGGPVNYYNILNVEMGRLIADLRTPGKLTMSPPVIESGL